MSFIRSSLIGGNQIAAAIASLGAEAKKALAPAEKAMSEPMVNAMRQATPVDTGTAKKAVGVRHVSYQGGLIKVGVVGFREGFKQIITRSVTSGGYRIRGKRTKLTKKQLPEHTEVRDPFYTGHLTVTGRKESVAAGKRMPIWFKTGKLVLAKRARAVAPSDWMLRVFESTTDASKEAGIASLRNSLGL